MMTRNPDRVALVVEDCVEYWRRTDVPRSAVAGMREELEQHLHDAVAAGKNVESVVGPDVLAFAEEWAREFRPAEAATRPTDGRGPGWLALSAGILILLAFLGIGAFVGSGSTIEVCCPRRVIEEGSTSFESGMLIWALLVLAVGVLSIVGAIFLFRGRLRRGGGIVLAAAPLALLTPVHVFAAAMLIGAGSWALSRARRAQSPVSVR